MTLRRLSGERYEVKFLREEPSDVFRARVAAASGVAVALLRLVRGDGSEVVKPRRPNTELVDGEIISLMVLLFSSATSRVRNLRFRLSWGYPSTGKDFLDGSCLIFCGGELADIEDYQNRNPGNGVKHSGDRMNAVGGGAFCSALSEL